LLLSRRRAVRALSSSVIVPQQDGGLLSRLANPALLTDVGVVWGNNDAGNDHCFPVVNPAQPDQVIAFVPIQSDVGAYIDRASAALPAWRDGTTAAARGELLRAWSERLDEHKNDLATIMTMESGKPRRESLAEVAYARSFLDYYAAEAIRPQGFTVPTPFAAAAARGGAGGGGPRGQILVTQHAVGVTGLITPWNFPLAMITRKVGPALAAGCTAIIKPSELTPLTALALQALLPTTTTDHQHYGPIVQTITPDRQHTAQVGEMLCTHPQVRKLSFTGSTKVGRQLMQWSSATIQRLSLELGGNAPFIVCDDAELNLAVDAAIQSKFRNAGQTCVCADRFLVQTNIVDDFTSELCRRIQSELRLGPGWDEQCNLGPLITTNARQAVQAKVAAAVAAGATLRLGGNVRPDLGPNFYEPTVLTNVSPQSDLWQTETFGPVVAIHSFTTDEECIRLANDTTYGLAAYVCTQNLARALRFTQRYEQQYYSLCMDGWILLFRRPFFVAMCFSQLHPVFSSYSLYHATTGSNVV
jgi:succinate-semialdehyde dehydrogenase / glutarate-semialdehyde dehydrogenase